MRRRIEFGLIFSLIALLVQIIAPTGATYAVANANPFDAMPICAHQGEDGSTPAPTGHDKSCPCCTLLCSVSHAAFPAPADIPAAIAAPQRLPQKLVFKVASFIPAARAFLPVAQPRAPPAFS
ncbi:DUF2946 family protein [Methyloferula stellata]|uniref:DUF2946 family protein n=1 Tax=Methyloferula stellata TaxID=876270 RepID=UPI0012686EE8|nr:DUF2946 family protein [Methyloferula stellata]